MEPGNRGLNEIRWLVQQGSWSLGIDDYRTLINKIDRLEEAAKMRPWEESLVRVNALTDEEREKLIAHFPLPPQGRFTPYVTEIKPDKYEAEEGCRLTAIFYLPERVIMHPSREQIAALLNGGMRWEFQLTSSGLRFIRLTDTVTGMIEASIALADAGDAFIVPRYLPEADQIICPICKTEVHYFPSHHQRKPQEQNTSTEGIE